MIRKLAPSLVLLLAAVVSPLPSPAFELGEMFKSKPPLTEQERRDTIERIKSVQDNLKLLQEKLRVLERRKAQEAAAARSEEPKSQPVAGEINWQAVDQNTVGPGDFGVYTYLLYNGSDTDAAALGSLEDLILTVETLAPLTEPAALGNRFLLPVEPLQSSVALVRRPYDFKLARTYLDRLGLGPLAAGPVLVSLAEPLDPYGMSEPPPFLAVVLGRQEPARNLALAKLWHAASKPSFETAGHPLAELFWQLLDGAGAVSVAKAGSRLRVDLAPPAQAAAPR